MPEPRWIRFEELGFSPSGKTERWAVVSKESGGCLGEVKWFSRWRRYAFYPEMRTLFEHQCLRDIATFCETRTREHRAGLVASDA